MIDQDTLKKGDYVWVNEHAPFHAGVSGKVYYPKSYRDGSWMVIELSYSRSGGRKLISVSPQYVETSDTIR